MAEKANGEKPTANGEKKPRKYIGPKYFKGLVMPDDKTYRPADFSDKEIEAFIAKFPRAKLYWK